MRCARCDFENIPGQSRCIRCGSILEAGGAVIQIHPPRMPAWKGPLRDAMRRLRGSHLVPQRSLASFVGPRFEAVVSDTMAGLALSIIPGLAHLLSGRFKEVRLFVALWFSLLSTGLFLYGSQIGWLLIAAAIGIHAWIAVRHGLFDKLGGFGERVGAVLILVVALCVLYWVTPRVLPGGIRSGRTALTIPALNIRSGDLLLVRRVSDANMVAPRGVLVLVRPVEVGNYRGRGRQRELNGAMIGQIVGLPGETIQVGGGPCKIGEQQLDPNAVPTPRWLQRVSPMSIAIPRGSYFISSEYRVQGLANQAVTTDMVRAACVVKASDIHWRAFMCWLPLSRRHFLPQEQE